MLTVWAVDPQRVRRGQLLPLECSAVVRDSDVGTWTCSVAVDDLSSRIEQGWRLIIVDDGMVISGPVLSFGVDVAADKVTLSGVDDLVHVADRLVYPNPAAAATAQTADAYYKVTGAAETVVRNMINLNGGPAALAVRRVAGMVVDASEGRGSSVTTNLRFKNLLEESRSLARLGGLSFHAWQDGASIRVSFRAHRDLSRRVRFSKTNGGLAGGSYQLNAPTVTNVVVAGQGEGTARTILERTQSSVWGRRIEQFQDRRDTDETADLIQAGDETLADGAEGASAEVDVNETEGLRYGVDYLLGDTVTAEFGATTISEPVRAVELSWDGHGRTASLTLGDHESDDDQSPAWVKHVRDLNARLRGLETR